MESSQWVRIWLEILKEVMDAGLGLAGKERTDGRKGEQSKDAQTPGGSMNIAREESEKYIHLLYGKFLVMFIYFFFFF
ncbi:hypothetical protein RchiOBHm_Chr1g0362151 [Rosa chinensis]|uniref:Uncharacterized protein n=1 Tax=Rosa chinensis TaxID=74649 RepID=A0A2P6SJ42_ROSCH|nr:hypothetical protein RchiOBHm_Chr1g0362151 [Rosa chinensis]